MSEAETRYERAKANTFGVGMACFSTEYEQQLTFANSFEKEAIAARVYIYELEARLARAREALDKIDGLTTPQGGADPIERLDAIQALARDTGMGGEAALDGWPKADENHGWRTITTGGAHE